jgi:hypothetical protein
MPEAVVPCAHAPGTEAPLFRSYGRPDQSGAALQALRRGFPVGPAARAAASPVRCWTARQSCRGGVASGVAAWTSPAKPLSVWRWMRLSSCRRHLRHPDCWSTAGLRLESGSVHTCHSAECVVPAAGAARLRGPATWDRYGGPTTGRGTSSSRVSTAVAPLRRHRIGGRRGLWLPDCLACYPRRFGPARRARCCSIRGACLVEHGDALELVTAAVCRGAQSVSKSESRTVDRCRAHVHLSSRGTINRRDDRIRLRCRRPLAELGL